MSGLRGREYLSHSLACRYQSEGRKLGCERTSSELSQFSEKGPEGGESLRERPTRPCPHLGPFLGRPLLFTGSGNILALAPPCRITMRGENSPRNRGVVAILEGVCPAPTRLLHSSRGSQSMVPGSASPGNTGGMQALGPTPDLLSQNLQDGLPSHQRSHVWFVPQNSDQ